MTVPNSYDTFSHAYTHKRRVHSTAQHTVQYITEFVEMIQAMSECIMYMCVLLCFVCVSVHKYFGFEYMQNGLGKRKGMRTFHP